MKIPVVGVGEASLHVASMLSADRFSVLVGRRKWIPKMAGNARIYGLDSRIASWRVLGLTVPDMSNRERTYAAILREAKAAVEKDRAEVVCLGCTGFVGQAKRVQDHLGVPILDPVLIGLKMAEFKATLWKKFGISHSKIGGYEAPPNEEFSKIYKAAYGTILRSTNSGKTWIRQGAGQIADVELADVFAVDPYAARRDASALKM